MPQSPITSIAETDLAVVLENLSIVSDKSSFFYCTDNAIQSMRFDPESQSGKDVIQLMIGMKVAKLIQFTLLNRREEIESESGIDCNYYYEPMERGQSAMVVEADAPFLKIHIHKIDVSLLQSFRNRVEYSPNITEDEIIRSRALLYQCLGIELSPENAILDIDRGRGRRFSHQHFHIRSKPLIVDRAYIAALHDLANRGAFRIRSRYHFELTATGQYVEAPETIIILSDFNNFLLKRLADGGYKMPRPHASCSEQMQQLSENLSNVLTPHGITLGTQFRRDMFNLRQQATTTWDMESCCFVQTQPIADVAMAEAFYESFMSACDTHTAAGRLPVVQLISINQQAILEFNLFRLLMIQEQALNHLRDYQPQVPMEIVPAYLLSGLLSAFGFNAASSRSNSQGSSPAFEFTPPTL